MSRYSTRWALNNLHSSIQSGSIGEIVPYPECVELCAHEQALLFGHRCPLVDFGRLCCLVAFEDPHFALHVIPVVRIHDSCQLPESLTRPAADGSVPESLTRTCARWDRGLAIGLGARCVSRVVHGVNEDLRHHTRIDLEVLDQDTGQVPVTAFIRENEL